MTTVAVILMFISVAVFIGGIVLLANEQTKPAIALIALAALMLITGFSHFVVDELNDPEQGTVIEKKFVRKHLVCAKVCTMYPDSWYLVLDDHGNVGVVQVKHSTYDNKQIGDYFGGSK